MKGRLGPVKSFNSLIIGTLQNFMYDEGIYPDQRPCGIFGINTRTSLEIFLTSKPFYRLSPHQIGEVNSV